MDSQLAVLNNKLLKENKNMVVIPEIVRTIVHRVDAAGGRALLVGGAVVDAILGNPIKD